MTLISSLARYWPFANGSGRLIDLYARDIDLGEGEQVARTTDGFCLRVLRRDHIGRHLLLTGRFDRSVVQVLLDQAKSGDVLLDVGANIGYVAACFLARVPDSTAICIEPQPGVVDLLRRNLAQFAPNVTTHQMALSDRTGELNFAVDPRNRGASRICDEGKIRVPALHAADLLEGLERLDLIKIDVEGHELPAFRAMEAELKRLRPRAILFEDQTGEAAPDGAIGSILARAGYRVHGVAKSLLRTRLVEVRSRQACIYNDYLALAL